MWVVESPASADYFEQNAARNRARQRPSPQNARRSVPKSDSFDTEGRGRDVRTGRGRGRLSALSSGGRSFSPHDAGFATSLAACDRRWWRNQTTAGSRGRAETAASDGGGCLSRETGRYREAPTYIPDVGTGLGGILPAFCQPRSTARLETRQQADAAGAHDQRLEARAQQQVYEVFSLSEAFSRVHTVQSR